MSLVWIVVVLLILGVVVAGAWRLGSVGSRWFGIVVLEGAALLYMGAVLVAEVVAPLARLANRTYVASIQEGRFTWQIDDLPVTLNEAG